MDILLIIGGIFFLLLGLAGCILPGLAGPPLSYVGLLLLHFTEKYQFSTRFLIIWAVITLLVSLLENFIPIWGTKKYGGSKSAIWGSAFGLLVGLFVFPPIGIIIFPFIGAVVGELSAGKETNEALRAGFGAFMGFVIALVMKLTVSGLMIFFFVKELIGS